MLSVGGGAQPQGILADHEVPECPARAFGEPAAGVELEIHGDRLAGSAWLPRSRGFAWEELVSPMAWRTSTDALGRFEFRGLYPGTFRVRSGLPSIPNDAQSTTVWALVSSAPLSEGGELVLRAGELAGSVSVRGTLRLPDGSVPAAVDVVFTRWVDGEGEPTTLRAGSTFAGGVFELVGLDPGRWSLEARALDGSGVHAEPARELGPGLHVFELVLEPPR